MRDLKIVNTNIYVLLIMLLSFQVNALEVTFNKKQEFFKDVNGKMREQDLRIPVVSMSDSEVEKRIELQISALVGRFKCDPKSSLYFTSSKTLSSKKILSFKYGAMYSCTTMPGPSSYDGGITFDLRSGKVVKLNEEISDPISMEKISNLVLAKYKETILPKNDKYGSCPEPSFSGNFYMDDRNLFFNEFFSSHYYSFCEIDVGLPIEEIRKYFRIDSILVKKELSPKNLKKSHSTALEYYRKKELRKALNELSVYFNDEKYLNYTSNIDIVNDYAFFLEKNGRYSEAVKVLKFVLSIQPNRVVAYINLADSLYANGNKDEAKAYYDLYIDKMKSNNKKNKIPSRVFSRI